MSEPAPAVSRAFVLAAGLGKRMRPVTATVPKPLVEVAGKALLDHALDRVAEAGIGTAVVNVHYLADLIGGILRAGPRGGHARVRRAWSVAGDGRWHPQGLAAAGRGAFVVLNSDSFWLEGPPPTCAG